MVMPLSNACGLSDMNMIKRFYFILMLLLPFAVIAATGDLDSAKSSIIATFKQEGVAVDAPFKKFSGNIVYDTKNIAGSTANIEVQTGSLDMGGPEYSNEVQKKAWFDSGTYPNAIFKSTSIKANGADQFVATGTLSIKGKSITLSVPVSVKNAAGVNSFDGSITISRAAFGIGGPEWSDVLDDKVSVRFHLVNAK